MASRQEKYRSDLAKRVADDTLLQGSACQTYYLNCSKMAKISSKGVSIGRIPFSRHLKLVLVQFGMDKTYQKQKTPCRYNFRSLINERSKIAILSYFGMLCIISKSFLSNTWSQKNRKIMILFTQYKGAMSYWCSWLQLAAHISVLVSRHQLYNRPGHFFLILGFLVSLGTLNLASI